MLSSRRGARGGAQHAVCRFDSGGEAPCRYDEMRGLGVPWPSTDRRTRIGGLLPFCPEGRK